MAKSRKGMKIERHGMKGTKIYMVWEQIKARCLNPNNKRWERYGGRGITVCDEWSKSFIAFYNDMIEGYAHGLQLDRIDNDSGYRKDNCRWVTPGINSANKSNVGKYMKGVSFCKKTNKFRAQIGIDKVKYALGYFKTEIEAHEVFAKVHIEWYGF
jgi:hypothetical protein